MEVRENEKNIIVLNNDGIITVCLYLLLFKREKIEIEKIPDMKAGETFQIKYTVKNTDDKEIVFRSSDTNVISVDEKGLLTAVSGGKSDITVAFKNDRKEELGKN